MVLGPLLWFPAHLFTVLVMGIAALGFEGDVNPVPDARRGAHRCDGPLVRPDRVSARKCRGRLGAGTPDTWGHI
ncbi:hypothetical protein HMPREF9604_02486 [Cutibacterium acnes HL036PA1]|nr:hypothetical protein HMPREF9604_02486 [Cutibacterium acnes HL036PA1]